MAGHAGRDDSSAAIRRLAVAAATLALVHTASAQDQLPPLVERVDVRVVNVDVTVVDGQGRPVLGLTRADFEILEDGKPQKITGFYAIENSAVLAERTAGERLAVDNNESFRRKLVLMVDNSSVDKVRRNRVVEEIATYVESDFGEDYEWSVISIGSEVQTLQPFTTESGEILSALLKIKESPSHEVRREIDRRLLSDPVRTRMRENEFESGYDFGETARFQSREQTMRNILATINTARAVIQTCRAYSAVAGRKLLMLVSGGMELNTSFTAFDTTHDRQMMEMKRQLEQILDAMAREANAANFTIYVINARGLEPIAPQHDVAERTAGARGNLASNFEAAGAFAKPADLSDRDSASLVLALNTGGRYLAGNAVRPSLESVANETSNFYSLGYAPAQPEDGKYHRIEVRVKRADLAVRHRAEYLAISPEARLEQSLRSPMTFPKEKGVLPVKVQLGLPARRGKELVLPINATLPLAQITMFPRGNELVGRVHVYLSIYDEHGNNVGYHHRLRELVIPTSQSPSLAVPLRHTMNVALRKGRYTIGVTMRDELTGEIGSMFQEVRL